MHSGSTRAKYLFSSSSIARISLIYTARGKTYYLLTIIQNEGLNLFRKLGGDLYQFQLGHTETIKRFGRFPKRNNALGRTSTPDELTYISAKKDRMF
ncbi:MAG: DUF924 family protein [Ahrensia sp.]|nr:DUF924 family protein [Ahrensia sp.]